MKIKIENEKDFDTLNNCQNLLFRGQSDSRFKLWASIYRKIFSEELLEKLEIIEHAKHALDHLLLKNLRAILQNEPGYKEWAQAVNAREQDLLIWAYLQHNNLGTPYLDWSRAFIIALLFALFKSTEDIANINFNHGDSAIIRSISKETVSIYSLPEKVLQKPIPSIVIIDPLLMETRYIKMTNQNAILLLNQNNYFWENSEETQHITKYNFDPSLGIQYLLNLVRNDHNIREQLEAVINDLKSPANLDTAPNVAGFLCELKETIEQRLSGNQQITLKKIKNALKEIDAVPSHKKGFDRSQLLGLGQIPQQSDV